MLAILWNQECDLDCLVSHCWGPGPVLGGLLILFWVSILPIHLTLRISESDYTFDFLSRSHKTSISIFSPKYFTLLYLVFAFLVITRHDYVTKYSSNQLSQNLNVLDIACDIMNRVHDLCCMPGRKR